MNKERKESHPACVYKKVVNHRSAFWEEGLGVTSEGDSIIVALEHFERGVFT